MMLASVLTWFTDVTFDVSALIVAVVALLGLHVVRKTVTKNESEIVEQRHVTERIEKVDSGVLKQFTELYERIGGLEVKLSLAETDIAEMKKQNEFMQGRLHEKDKEIAGLKAALTKARNRIIHLENLCESLGHNVRPNGRKMPPLPPVAPGGNSDGTQSEL